MAFREQQLVIFVADLARFTQAVAGMDALGIAALVDRFYRSANTVLGEHGGRAVNFFGDACLAVFPPDRAAGAVDAAEALAAEVAQLRSDLDIPIETGVNLHLATVAEGEFGDDGRYDVMGLGVIHAFRMGNGPGIRISEPVYRKLASSRRGGWEKRQPPATYTKAMA